MGMIHGRHLVSRSFVLLVILSTGRQRSRNRLHRKKGQKDQARAAPSLTSHSFNMQLDEHRTRRRCLSESGYAFASNGRLLIQNERASDELARICSGLGNELVHPSAIPAGDIEVSFLVHVHLVRTV